jgi:ribosomal protein L22
MTEKDPTTPGADDAEAEVQEEAAEAKATEATEEKPKPKRKPAAEKKAATETETEGAEAEEKPKPARKPRAKKAAEPVAEAAEAEADADEADEAPKPKRTRAKKSDEKAKPAAAPAPTRKREAGELITVRAHAKFVRVSARKARLIADHVRGKDVNQALAILAFSPRSVAEDWTKVLKSAIANAEHNHDLVGDDLRVLNATADEGPTLKRYRPRAMGRATRIRKRTSHLTITLTPKD